MESQINRNYRTHTRSKFIENKKVWSSRIGEIELLARKKRGMRREEGCKVNFKGFGASPNPTLVCIWGVNSIRHDIVHCNM